MQQSLVNILSKMDGKFLCDTIDENTLFVHPCGDPPIEYIVDLIDKLRESEYNNFKIVTERSVLEDRNIKINILQSSSQFSRDTVKGTLLNREESLRLLDNLKLKISESSTLSKILFYSSKVCKLIKIIKEIDNLNSWSNRCIKIIGDKKNLTNFKMTLFVFKFNSVDKVEIVNGIPITIKYKLGILCQKEEKELLVGDGFSPP